MKSGHFFAALLIGSLVGVVSGQTPPRQSGAAGDAKQTRQVTLTGCLVLVPASDRADAGFMLINASPAPSVLGARPGTPETGSTGVGTTGTGTSGTGSTATPTTAQDAAQVTFLLMHGRKNELRRHVNHRVEVRGTMSDAVDAAKVDAQPQTQALQANPPQVQVTRIRRLAGTCSGKQ